METQENILQINIYDMKILMYLKKHNFTHPLKAASKKELVEKFNLNSSTIHNYTRKLSQLEYIEEGYKEGRAKRFYITEKGIAFINSEIGNKLNEEE